ncbi:hypothetical protein BX666DRAFT_734686 [Dichotomocladium elegans]|nr:hypothetical protein BX666DRAFT_734686 [Dichotomocladium elegans]
MVVCGCEIKRAISDQMYRTEDAHRRIRQDICDFIERNRTEYEHFVDEATSFEDYVEEMRQVGTYGGNLELAAFAKMAGCDIKIYQPGLVYVIPGRPKDYKGKRIIYHLAYYDWEHYASIGVQPGNNSLIENQPLPERYRQFHDGEEYGEDVCPSSSAMDSFETEDAVEDHQDSVPGRAGNADVNERAAKTEKKSKATASEKRLGKAKRVPRKQKMAVGATGSVQEPESDGTEPSKDDREDVFKQENEEDESAKRRKHPKKKATLTRQEEKKLKKLAKLKRQEQLADSKDGNHQHDDDRLPDGMKLLYI